MKTCSTLRALFLLVALSFGIESFAASSATEYALDHEVTIHADAQLIFLPRKSENGEKEKEKETNKEASEETSVVVKEESPVVLDAVSGATNPLTAEKKKKDSPKVRTARTNQNTEELFWLRKKVRPDVEFSPFPMVL